MSSPLELRQQLLHKKYNPITHLGDVGVPAEARSKGLKLAEHARTAGHLTGAACIPAAGGGGSDAAVAVHKSSAHVITAKIDHLLGPACFPSAATEAVKGSFAGGSCEGTQHYDAQAAPVNLRASVDHLAGQSMMCWDSIVPHAAWCNGAT